MLKTSGYSCSFALLFAACSSAVSTDREGPARYVLRPGACVRLLSNVTAFWTSFSRFNSDPLNGLTDAKLARIGQLVKINTSFNGATATCEFSDGAMFDFPTQSFELVEKLECTVVGIHMCIFLKGARIVGEHPPGPCSSWLSASLRRYLSLLLRLE